MFFFFVLFFGNHLILCNYFYKVKNQTSKRHFCECGFKSLSDLNIQINLNFILLAVFLILYDIEFTLLFPILFNILLININQYIYFIFFIILIISSLYFDIQMNALS